MERRKAARYGLRVPVFYSWEDSQPQHAGGFTRDISASGAYVLCEKGYCPAQGDTVAIKLIFPPIADMDARGMRIEFEGQVLRTGDCQRECGFAVLAEYGMKLNTGNEDNGQSGRLT